MGFANKMNQGVSAEYDEKSRHCSEEKVSLKIVFLVLAVLQLSLMLEIDN